MTYIGEQLEVPAADGAVSRSHNAPPLDQMIVEQFEDKIDSVDGLRARIRQLLEKDGALPDLVDSDGKLTKDGTDETAGKMGDLIKMIGAAADKVDGIRVEIKRPYLDATRALDSKGKFYDEGLDKIRRQARAKLTAYVQYREAEARKAAELERQRLEEERKAAEAAAAARGPAIGDDVEEMVSKIEAEFGGRPTTPAKPTSEPIARGDYGARVGTRSVWKAEIVDVKKLPKAVLDHPKVVEAILSVLNQQVRSGIREIKGARVFETTEASVR